MWDSRENGQHRLTSTLLLWFRVGLQNPAHPKNVITLSFCTAKYPWHPHHRDFSNPQILLVHTRSWVQPQKGNEHERLKSTLSQLAVSTARSQLKSTGGLGVNTAVTINTPITSPFFLQSYSLKKRSADYCPILLFYVLKRQNYIQSVNSGAFFGAVLNLCLEKAMTPHSSTLAWKIPWMEEPGRLQSMGLLRVGHDWAT